MGLKADRQIWGILRNGAEPRIGAISDGGKVRVDGIQRPCRHDDKQTNKQTNTITLLFNQYITQCAMHTLQIMFNGVKDIKHNSGVDGI